MEINKDSEVNSTGNISLTQVDNNLAYLNETNAIKSVEDEQKQNINGFGTIDLNNKCIGLNQTLLANIRSDININYTNITTDEDNNTRRRQLPMCARCKVHGIQVLIRGHKSNCKFSKCTCDKCVRIILVTRSQKIRRASRIETNPGQRYCVKCQNHGKWSDFKGHKDQCPFEECNCQVCQTGGIKLHENDEDNDKMDKQIIGEKGDKENDNNKDNDSSILSKISGLSGLNGLGINSICQEDSICLDNDSHLKTNLDTNLNTCSQSSLVANFDSNLNNNLEQNRLQDVERKIVAINEKENVSKEKESQQQQQTNSHLNNVSQSSVAYHHQMPFVYQHPVNYATIVQQLSQQMILQQYAYYFQYKVQEFRYYAFINKVNLQLIPDSVILNLLHENQFIFDVTLGEIISQMQQAIPKEKN